MVNVYVSRILAGLMTIDDVPGLWREEVRAIVEGVVPDVPDTSEMFTPDEVIALVEGGTTDGN